jgi:large subunit ribosomal protein L5
MSTAAFYTPEKQKQVMKDLELKNPMMTPRIQKIILNIGVGEAVVNKSAIQHAQEQLTTIAGQKAVVTMARKSISAFKIRKGFPNGVKVTLRGSKMNFFLEKLITIIIPRIKDFRGIAATCVDQNGNLNIGFREQTIFPEIEYDKIDKIRGLQVTVVTTAGNKVAGKKLFEIIGIPFKAE